MHRKGFDVSTAIERDIEYAAMNIRHTGQNVYKYVFAFVDAVFLYLSNFRLKIPSLHRLFLLK